MDVNSNKPNDSQPVIKYSAEVEYSSEPGNKSGVWFMAGAVVVAGLTVSKPAHAGLDGILNSLVSKFSDMFDPLLNNVFGGFGELLNAGTADSSAGIMQSVAASGDVQIKALQEIDNARVMSATEPPPDFCLSDELGAASKVAGQSSQKTMDSVMAGSSNLYDEKVGSYTTGITSISQRYQEPGLENGHIKMASKLSQSRISDSTDQKAIVDGLDVMTAGAMDGIQLNSADANSTSNKRRAYYLQNSAKAARLEIAKSAFASSLADRVTNEDGMSKFGLIEDEINRTYGGDGNWRNDIVGYADPTPLLSELNKQQSLTNYLLFESLKKMDQQNLLISTNIIEVASRRKG